MDLEPSLTADARGAEIAPANAGVEELPKVPPIVAREEKRMARAQELCERAGSPDWIYIGVLGALDVGSVLFDSQVAKYNESLALRIGGPAFIGLAWGGTLGSLPLVVSQCEWPGTPRMWGLESGRHSELPLMISMSILSGATAPFLVGLETGPIPKYWPLSERSGRLIAAGVGGAIGALIPYILPPRPFRAMRELRNLDVQVGGLSLDVKFHF